MDKEDNLKDTLKSIVIAVSIIGIIFLGLYIYSGIWPPLTIIESSSMQHGNDFTWGVINTGDIIIPKKVTNVSQIITYVEGRETNYSTYGDFGNVILYYPEPNTIPVIHRAIFYITWNGPIFHIRGESKAGKWLEIIGYKVVIMNMGFSDRNLVVDLSKFIGEDGFITMGDNNLANSGIMDPNIIYPDIAYYAADQNVGIAPRPITLSMIYGIATGWLPWFGDIKLILVGQTNDIPTMSYVYLGITLTIIVLSLFLYDFWPRRDR
ncbi:MAG: S26 family signal peptidase [Euryarchaeota archaeon]|jgi:signal peptidase|nr:S26 family signal peptidase [Euryarchaeota archaeon]